MMDRVKMAAWFKDRAENTPMPGAKAMYQATYDLLTRSQWISVHDRLPQQGERVLATDGAFVGEMYINKRDQWQRYNVNDSSLMMALDILWWMPMPEPPEGGVEE